MNKKFSLTDTQAAIITILGIGIMIAVALFPIEIVVKF